MKKNQLTTNKTTNFILGKSKSLMGITKKILEDSSKNLLKAKASHELAPHHDITIIGDFMWEKESREMDWDSAMEYAKNLRLCGYDDWRLPTKEEFSEIVTLCGGVTTEYRDDDWIEITEKNGVNEVYQANYKAKGFTSYVYWSSTTYEGDSSDAWDVSFDNGYQYYGTKDSSFYVRCVRTGQ